MRGILLNVLFVTLTGCTILAIRKIWGAKLYPQVLKGFWLLFFICALLPMSSADRLGRAAMQMGGEQQEVSIKYSYPMDDNGKRIWIPGDSMESMDRYRVWGKLKRLSLMGKSLSPSILRIRL